MQAEIQLTLEKLFCSEMENLNPYLELIRRQFDFFLQKKYQYFTHISFLELSNFSGWENILCCSLGTFVGCWAALITYQGLFKLK